MMQRSMSVAPISKVLATKYEIKKEECNFDIILKQNHDAIFLKTETILYFKKFPFTDNNNDLERVQ